MADKDNLDLNEQAKETLRLMKADLHEGIDDRTTRQINAIEAAIQLELKDRREAKRVLASKPLSYSSIADRASGLSRPTLYNKTILKDYIDFRRRQEGLEDDTSELEALREKLREAEDTIEKMTRRDAEIVMLRLKLQRSETRIVNLERYIEGIPVDLKDEIAARGHVISFSDISGEKQC